MTENVVENYGWYSAEPSWAISIVYAKVLSILQSHNFKRVLDLGSGNGALCSRLAQKGFDVVGVEYDKDGVEIARQNHPEIPFYNYGVQDDSNLILAEEQPFDAVVSTDVIEHLFSPHLLPIYAAGVLKPGGCLILTTPYHGYLKNLVLSIFNKWDHHHSPLWHGGHIKFWSRKTMSQLLFENGFQIDDIFGVGRCPYVWKSMVVVARKQN